MSVMQVKPFITFNHHYDTELFSYLHKGEFLLSKHLSENMQYMTEELLLRDYNCTIITIPYRSIVFD